MLFGPAGSGDAFFRGRLAHPKIGVYLRTGFFQYLTFPYGPVAQLIERVVRNDEVVGLIPICSTIFKGRFPRGSVKKRAAVISLDATAL